MIPSMANLAGVVLVGMLMAEVARRGGPPTSG